MEIDRFVEEFKVCKIKAIDIAYMETSKKLGPNHAREALKYILFDVRNKYEEVDECIDKYLYISSKSGGRELLKLLDIYDVYHILTRYSMEMCTINDLNFTTVEKDNPKNVADNKIIEYIANVAFSDLGELVKYFENNRDIVIRLFDSLIDNRYRNGLLEELEKAYQKMNKSYLKVYDSLTEYFDNKRMVDSN